MWASKAEANAYISQKINSADWFAPGFDCGPYLTTAYRMISNDPDYAIPDSPNVSQLDKLKNAQIEFAFFLLQNPNYAERRNLISQGVSSFSISRFSETYDPRAGGSESEGFSKYPVEVSNYLKDFLRSPSLIGRVTRRRENII